VVRGDPAARDAFVRTYWPRIFALGLQLSGSRVEAEDLAQDVMLSALSALSSFEGRSELFTWLYRIALRRYARTRRRRIRMPEAASADDTRLELALVVDAGPDPRRRLELREQYRLLLLALDGLPSKLRTAVILVAVHGLSLEEAGHVLGIPSGTVGWRVHEARSQMHATLHRLSQPEVARPRQARAARGESLACLTETLDSLRALLGGHPELSTVTKGVR